MQRPKKYLAACLCLFLLSGATACSKRIVSVSSPRYSKVDNDYYYFSITPLSANERHCGFRLILKNKTGNTIFVDWNRSYYICNDERSGGFIFDGINYDTRHDIIPLEKIRGWDIFIKTIWPVVLAKGTPEELTQMPMEEGVHGVEVAVVIDGRIITERLAVNISNIEK